MTELGTVAALSCHAVERMVCDIWSRHFGRTVSPYDDFFDLGGDSFGLIDVVAEARERGLPVRSSVAFRNPSPARLAESMTIGCPEAGPAAEPPPVRLPALYADASRSARERAAAWTPADRRPVPVVAGGVGAPLYLVHSDSHAELERAAASGWAGDRPVRGFPLRGFRGLTPPVGTVPALAAQLRDALRDEQPAGPYRLVGFGHGAVLAYEAARQLRERGETVAALVLVRPPAIGAGAGPRPARDGLLRQRLAMLAGRFALTGTESVEEIFVRARADGWYDDGTRAAELPWLQLAWVELTLAAAAYDPPGYDAPVLLFVDATDPPAAREAWACAAPHLEVHRLDHGLQSPAAILRDDRVARAVRAAVDR